MQTQSKAQSHITNPITSLHPSQSPNKSPRTKKHAETPPTYPFPAYSIVKDPKNKTTGHNLPSRNVADEPNCQTNLKAGRATRWSERLFLDEEGVNPEGG